MNLGNVALALAIAAGGVALAAYFLWARGQADLRGPARLWLYGMALGVFVASAFQMWNIVTHQFQYQYVTNFSDRSLPTLLLAASFWGGQSGSLLLWSLWSVIFGLVLIAGLRRSAWEPFVLTPYVLITLSITILTLAAQPFKLLAETPADGNGLNPLLQNYWMAIHPPILFTGFTTMAAPFVFAIAALWRRDYDGWVRMARPWALLAWACLGVGLALGGFWAYESLGWGGFWGWDPVENSSLVPWLFASALLHGLVLQGARGSFKRANLLLAISGYLMVVYSTFLTRSGLWGRVSIHSFVELGLMRYLLAFLLGFALLGFGALVWRWRDTSRRVLYHSVLSREWGLLVSAGLFVALALLVGIATSMPVITMLPLFASQASVDMAFYGPAAAPFGLLLLVTMAVFPLLGWQRARYGSLARTLRGPAALTGAVIVGCLLLNVIYPVALLFIAAAVFAAATNAVVIRRIWRAGPLKLGGYLCHVGVGLLFVGVVGTSYYKQTAALQLTQDTPQLVFGRQWTLRGLVLPPDDPLRRTAVQIEVTDPRDGRTWLAQAPYYTFQKTGQLVIHPAIQSGLWSDLYIAPSEYRPPAQTAPGRVRLMKDAPQQLLGYTFTFTKFELPDREAMLRGEGPAVVNAVVAVTAPDGTTTTVKPNMEVQADQAPIYAPVPLAGGATLALAGLEPENQAVEVQLGGVDLSKVDPEALKARAFVEVSREPGIKFVWTGTIISILGGMLALLRRWREARPTTAPANVRGAAPIPARARPVAEPALARMAQVESEAG